MTANSKFSRHSRRLLTSQLVIAMVAVLGALMLWTSDANAQSQQMPKPGYYFGFNEYYQGEYDDALRRFRSAYNASFRIGNNRFIDSVCPLVMMGECHFQVGDYTNAMQMYNAAMELYLDYDSRNWQSSVTPPAQILASTTAVQKARVTWGRPSRTGAVANIPDSLSVMRGRLDAILAYEQGGLYDPAEIRSVDVTEVMRCLALAIHRRRYINGPAGKYDAMSVRLAAALRTSRAGNGTYFGTLNGIAYGMALSAIGEHGKAIPILTRSLQMAGGLDHPLTPVGLAELANIALVNEHFAEAKTFGAEASYSAAAHNQYDMIEEGLTTATQAHLVNDRSVWAPLPLAITWASRERARMLQASLAVSLAECFAESGDVRGSVNALAEAEKVIGRRNSLEKTATYSRLKYLAAVNEFLSGDVASGRRRLADALTHLGTRSPWIYRLKAADAMAVAGTLTEKQADALYSLLLQDPTDLQWKLAPIDAMAYLMTPHLDAMERWLTIAINRKQTDRALEIADTIRRHRFYSNLPMFGRLLSLRWVLHGDDSLLDDEAKGQRSSFLTRYPEYRRMLNESAVVRDQLRQLPLSPAADSDEFRQQKRLTESLGSLSQAMSGLLWKVALLREPASMAFPPKPNAQRIGESMPQGQVAIVTLETKQGYQMFSIERNRSRYLGLVSSNAVRNGLGAIVKEMGVSQPVADSELVASEAWKDTVELFEEALLEDFDAESIGKIDELVVVPDGLFWYLPLESFFISRVPEAVDADVDGADVNRADANDAGGDGDRDVVFAEAMKIRYCPTLSLAFAKPQDRAVAGPAIKTGLVTGALLPRTTDELSRQYSDLLIKDHPEMEAVPALSRLPSSLFAWRMDQLVNLTWSGTDNPWEMLPMPVDRGGAGSSLADWVSLGSAAPRSLVLPGLNSIGGPDYRSRADGSDLFIKTTALMASGAKSILASRWNSGGQTQMELAGRFAIHSQSMNSGEALQRAIAEVRSLPVDPAKEPRMKFANVDLDADGEGAAAGTMTADHPFFYAQAMLVALPEVPMTVSAEASDDAADGASDDAAGVVVGGAMDDGVSVDDAMPDGGARMTADGVVTDGEKAMPDSGSAVDAPAAGAVADDEEEDEGAVWQIGGPKEE